jgi:NADP-dependent 3-hydroxy acid dehydrogenase YdfG
MSKQEVSTRRVLVTGASSGIGWATAVKLAEAGWKVVAAARRTEKLAYLAERFANIEPFTLDVTNEDDVAVLAKYLADTGGLNAIVNNAGGAIGLDPVETSPVLDWQRMYDVNVLGTLRVTQALLPLLRASTSGSTDRKSVV